MEIKLFNIYESKEQERYVPLNLVGKKAADLINSKIKIK